LLLVVLLLHEQLDPHCELSIIDTMPGYILGTGGGVAAAAAVYYTLSTNMDQSTARVRSE
jgi:altered-inheritance-of-mitochondria protein 5